MERVLTQYLANAAPRPRTEWEVLLGACTGPLLGSLSDKVARPCRSIPSRCCQVDGLFSCLFWGVCVLLERIVMSVHVVI